MKKAIVGISAMILRDMSAASEACPVQERMYANREFVDAIRAAGGVPLILPVTADEDIIRNHVNICDAFVLHGGHDANPVLFGEEPSEKSHAGGAMTDLNDISLIRLIMEADKPLLGVCRGMQMMNLVMGGTLYQDISEYDAELKAGVRTGGIAASSEGGVKVLLHNQPGPEWDPYHTVRTTPGTKTAALFGETVPVNSHHHQAVKDPAPGAVISASAMDGVVEAIEFPEKKFALGLQWHPEIMMTFRDGPFADRQRKVFEALIDAAAK